MSRILLADDSPHAQRMGERILREEGFEVVSLTDGDAAMLRLADVDPDLILADVFLPGKSGVDLCRYVKSHPRFKHVRVVLTAGLLEPFDEDEAKRAGCDAILKKPFEASKVVSTIDPLVKEAQLARGLFAETFASAPPLESESPPASAPPGPPKSPEPPAPEIDPERVRAAITLALDAALPAMIQEITERVLIALGH
jgi:CheY-like chemotaxis protein